MARSADSSGLDLAPLRRAEPLREAVYARVVRLVNDGQFPPGSQLTEAQISRALGVSRTPVREALLRLASEGVLDSALAKGFTVRSLSVLEARELYPILSTLESLAVRSIVSPPSSKVGELSKIAERRDQEGRPLKRRQLDNDFHARLVALSENESLISLVSQLRTNLSRYEITYVLNIDPPPDYDGQHQRIAELVGSGDLAAAADLVTLHWNEGMQSVVEWLESRAHSER